jgi:hypothetical protein
MCTSCANQLARAEVEQCSCIRRNETKHSHLVAECDTCQRTLQLLPIPPTIWIDISMDLIVGLPKSGNKSIIMVVVDHLSKYAHFYAFQHLFTSSTVAQFFMDNIFKLYGMPHSIVSDCHPPFTNTFLK